MTNLGKVACRFVGNYETTTSYESADIVSYGGATYGCRKPCMGVMPTDTEYWQYMGTVSTATKNSLGVVKPDGTTITIDADGTIHGGSFNLPIASKTVLGGVKVDGTTITIDPDTGVISGASTYELPTASTTVLGGVKIGDGINIDADGKISVDVQKATIEVSTENTDLFGKTVNLTGAETGTETFSSTGKCAFKVATFGTYTITSSTDTDIFTVEVEVDSLTLYKVVLSDAYGYKNWLKSVGKDASAYASLDDVLADEKLVRELMTRHASVDYLVEWLTKKADAKATFLASDNALKWIGLRDYAYDTMPQDFITSWLASDKWELALKDKVPVMTSDTAPYGEAFTNSANASYTPAYYVFDGNDSTRWMSNTDAALSGANVYVGYKFTNPISIKKVIAYVLPRGSESLNVEAKFKIQVSNDNSTWKDVSTEISTIQSDYTLKPIAFIINDSYYSYCRIIQTSGKAYGIATLQFYGRSLNVSVPTMTSNTEPWGEVISSSGYMNPLQNAFDGNDSTFTGTSGGGSYLGYNFNKPIRLLNLKLLTRNATVYSRTVNLVLEYKTETSDWITTDKIATVTRTEEQSPVWFRFDVDLVGVTSVRFRRTDSESARSVIYTLQFYALDYSEREFAEGSTMKYLYDHGVELEEIECINTGGTSSKENSYLSIKGGSTSGADGIVQTKNNIDFTNHTIMRAIVSNAIKHSSYVYVLMAGVSRDNYAGFATVNTPDLPNNGAYRFGKTISQSLKAIAYANYSGGASSAEITEWWLE